MAINEQNKNISGGVKTLIAFYCAIYKDKFNLKPYVSPADIKMIKILLVNYGIDQLKDMIRQFLALNDEFLKKVGYQLRFLGNSVNKIISSSPIKINSMSQLSNESLLEFLRQYKNKQWDPGLDGETLTKSYLKEIQVRGLTEKDLKVYINTQL